ncbi:MAG: DUF1552 domain-containing protein [Pseudomonadota bacterium]
MIFDQKNNRRLFLKGAGASLALPFLASASNKVKAATKAPVRFVTIISLHGLPYSVRSQYFVDKNKPGKLGTLLPILAPFENYRDNLIVLSGVDDKIGGGGGHQYACCRVLTGRNNVAETTIGNGPSLDYYLSQKIGVDTAYPLLNLHVQSGWQPGGYTWTENNIAPSALSQPQNIFNHLFSNFNPTTAAQSPDILNRRSVIDFVKNDLAKITNNISSSDKARLDQHITSIRELENRIALTNSCTKPTGQWTNNTNQDRLPQTLALAAYALACDLSRIVTININGVQTDEVYSWVNDPIASTIGHHSISHEDVSIELKNSYRIAMAKIRTWHSEKIKIFLDQLANSIDVDGSRVLDNTVVLWTTEVSQGYNHSAQDFPFVLIAGKNTGLIQGGHHFNFQGRAHNDVLTTILKTTGQSDVTFGQTDLNQGPLTQLFV